MNKGTDIPIDMAYLQQIMLELFAIPCPTGFTDRVVYYVCNKLQELGISYDLTRRGTIRAHLKGAEQRPDRAIVTHLDTIGAMLREVKANGRLSITPIGHWSSRFAEGARVTIFSDNHSYRGTVLPLLAAGHAFNEAIDSQPINWDQVEVRIDEHIRSAADVYKLGMDVGDFIAFDPNPELLDNGYIVSRHLDNKAGTAALLAALKAVLEYKIPLAIDCHPIFTLTEEVGSGVGHALDEMVTEFVGVDIAPVAPGQNSTEFGVTIALKDSSGPFDYHLSRHLIGLCKENNIPYQRDVFRFYYSDALSAVQAGHDIRHSLITFGTDATHGYERTHLSALESVAKLLVAYMESGPALDSDKVDAAPMEEFAKQLKPENMPKKNTSVPDINSL
ncbi:osmoprotectant NAGGN system M42 family peptidase [Zooshikella ganghwensis]|uniref:Osmoprotectant NAGGN system M42 family peptidase n=1 Tax=Zooshikella ganghwensis TaxID=202772 RepID=A0A4P9VQ89_9GAMM|nr:osmoprotectant NAGGN system M42 family peptidase [Zooshikella ganghwensis]RDH44230.1 osmoprotectant NAGGN system M42 family peptidase [Zooshikella ganghwensis]